MVEGSGGRILHLDDDTQYAASVAERLEAETDLSVATVTEPADAIGRLEAEAFHCLLCEFRFPGGDGLAIVHRVRESNPGLPIVILTGEGSESVASDAISAGVTDYFGKDRVEEQFDVLGNRLESAVENYRTGRKHRGNHGRDDEFVRLVAHDLRNPMAVARGWIEVLYEDGGEIPYRKAVDALYRMDDIVDNLETLARSDESGAGDGRIELSAVATAAWELVEADGADLHVEYGPEVGADVSMLQQILENLFTNAVEHGGEDVTVRIGTTDEGFFVADDGAGIDPSERDRIFESGYTGDGGSGLGLAIVERIADAHGWEVAVGESEEGGARFDFTGVALELPRDAFR